ncbi:MAG: hypothetical protein ALAOOOJD_00404 [bacterium]|nr:hypothetical protein [bacterium]
MAENIIYFQPTKRKKFARSFNHVLAGVLLLLLGVENLSQHGREHLIFAILSILAGAAVLVAFVRELRQSAHPEPHGVNWVDVFAGIVILLEAWHKYKPEKGFQPATLLFIVGIVSLGFGIFHGKLAKFARLHCDANGFFARMSPFKKLQMAWQDIAAVQLEPSAIHITAKNQRRHRLSLRLVENRSAVTTFFDDNWRRYGTPQRSESA